MDEMVETVTTQPADLAEPPEQLAQGKVWGRSAAVFEPPGLVAGLDDFAVMGEAIEDAFEGSEL